ncbi:MAG TPA: ATP-binding cassette domain-containing protein, partial [Acidimicrobiales bacterium]|nr:ATP-binding cassette domain-containing protein [Acidimicrobiales bacterium]
MVSAAGAQSLLVAEGVSKRFGSTQALRKADLTVAPGELVGLAGHNGAGKSTLLRAVTALVRPDEGRIEIRGTRLSAGASVKEVRALGVRTVHQELSLCPALRVDESAALVDRTAKGPRWRRRAWRSLGDSLDDIFPGHGIRPGHR